MGFSQVLEALADRRLEEAAADLESALGLDCEEEMLALPLHLLALIEFLRREPNNAVEFLEEVADIEQRLGYETLGDHSYKQVDLVADPEQNLASLAKHYREAIEAAQLKNNYLDAALSLKSLGELFLVRGERDRAVGLFEKSRLMFKRASDPAAGHLSQWCTLLATH
ncbi:MAG: hypothetical protein HYV63_04470 [Candidatus Schekmanbacteria bacterium]|nr:hypothetical protein [Candidatus Schekmanbacteria bacterium]